LSVLHCACAQRGLLLFPPLVPDDVEKLGPHLPPHQAVDVEVNSKIQVPVVKKKS
jgi:hypothetical protein